MSSDRFERIKLLGKGNFTEGVFLVRQVDVPELESAVKLLRTSALDRDELLQEARLMAALPSNDHVVKVISAGDWDDDLVYIEVEYCSDGSLDDRCSGFGLDPASACRFVSDACRGLHFMHQNGILHLDLRPANIMLSGNVPKIGDFGLARKMMDPSIAGGYTGHLAPEIAAGAGASAKSDQYSMAMTLAHLMSGGRTCAHLPSGPFNERTWEGTSRLDRLGPNVPDRLRKVIDRATKYRPAARYDSVEEFKRALDRATPGVSFSMRSPTSFVSACGVWSVDATDHRGGQTVTVKKNGRAQSAFKATGLSTDEMRSHVCSVVKHLAYG